MDNGDYNQRPDWDDPTDPGLGQPQSGQNPPRYGQPPRHQYGPQYGGPPPSRPPYGQAQPGPRPYGQPGRPKGGPRPNAYNDDTDFGPEPNSNRKRTIIVVGSAVALVIALVTVGVVLLSPGSRPDPVAANDPETGSTSASSTPTLDPTTPPTTTTPPAPPKTSATRKVIPRPTVTVTPPAKEIPPPPPPPDPTCTAPTYHGTAAPRDTVKAALLAAGSVEYWKGVQLDPNLSVPLPKITIPANLMKAIAWQESGWQSNIESCDHGIGVMQVMKDTADDTNRRFGTSYDINTLQGNTQLGAEYLERLIMYFGIYHYGQNFSLDTIAPVGPNNEQYSLLQVVVAAYNVGVGNVENGDDIVIGPVGRQYSNNVIALMSNCECLAF
jgi:Transglycosylase SLT domain